MILIPYYNSKATRGSGEWLLARRVSYATPNSSICIVSGFSLFFNLLTRPTKLIWEEKRLKENKS